MKTVEFKFHLEQKVTAEKNSFSGIVTMCAIQGNPENPERMYYVTGPACADWYSERLLKEAE